MITVLLSTLGCGLPHDPEGTFTRMVRTGVLRAGVTGHPPWTDTSGQQADGIEAALIESFAARHGARVEWRPDSESALFEALTRFELDVVVGGFTDDTPWAPRVGLTQPYVLAGPDDSERHVMAVPPGENRMLVELGRFLLEHAAAVAPRVGGRVAS